MVRIWELPEGSTRYARGSDGNRPARFVHPAVRDWFTRSFERPTEAQAQAWPAIAGGSNVLVSAPTGSGKTLAAFLWGLDRLVAEPADPRRTRLVYVSPLKALSYDVEKNLRAPLKGIGGDIEVAIRTGDTPQRERQAMLRKPPDVLITTPESLYLMLTSRAREFLVDAEAVIVDEIHAVAQTKRGAHLAITLERLEHLAGRPLQRIGLSATQRPLEEVGRFLVGPGRECEIVDTGVRKPLDVKIQVPVEDMREPDDGADLESVYGGGDTRRSIWPAIYPELLELVKQHRSTIIFVNARRGAERLAMRLNELAGEDGEPAQIARAHHGSLAREERLVVEDLLKSGELPCLVATSSLELGIDMGAVDLVLQVESPKSVTAGLQRIGRAGHGVGEVSKGRVFPKFRADLLECAVVVKRMHDGEIEQTVVPRNPLDVLAQQIVAATATGDDWKASELHDLVRRAYPFAELSRELFDSVLDMLDGRYPSEEFAELRPADRLGPGAGHDPIAQGRPPARRHERRDHPRPRPLRRPPAGRAPGGRARRGDGLRGPRGPDLPAGRVHLADRGDHPRPRDRDPRPRRAGRAALLEGRRHRPACRAGPRHRRVRPRGGRPRARGAGRRVLPRRARREQPRDASCASSATRRGSCRATARS